MARTLRDSHSYETQIIDAVRSVNRALGGTYGTSSAIYKSEFNQYEVQLIDAIKGVARTLSGNGLSLAGGGDLSGLVTQKEFQSLSARVTRLESESFFRLVDGNVTLKTEYNNLWVPGWLAAGGIGEDSGGGTGTDPEAVHFTSQTLSSSQQAQARTNINAQEAFLPSSLTTGFLRYSSGHGWSLTTPYLYQLGDVNIQATYSSAYEGRPLVYHHTNQGGEWVIADSPGGGGDIYIGHQGQATSIADVSLWSFANGQVLYYDSGVWTNTRLTLSDISLPSGVTGSGYLYYTAGSGWSLSPGSGGGGGGDISSVALASGTNNGTLKLTVVSGQTSIVSDNVAVTGLGNLAFENALSLGGLSGVTLSSPSNGQALVFRNNVWQNETLPSGGSSSLSQLDDVSINTSTLADGHVLTWDSSAGTSGMWVNAPNSGGGGGGTVTSVTLTEGTGVTVSNSGTAITTIGTRTISISSTYQGYISHGETAYGWGDHSQAGYLTSYTETDPTVPAWAKDTIPGLYIGMTRVQTSSAAQDLKGISSINATSSTSSSSRIVWEPNAGGTGIGAWHFYGNLYADGWVSAGGVGSGGGGGGSSTLEGLDDVILSSSLSANQILYYYNNYWRNTSLKTVNGESLFGSGNITVSGGSGTVTSVALTVPTGLSVSGSPITSSGTLAISFATGYSIPTTAKQGQWDDAYSLVTGSQAKNKVLASPSNAAGAPSFRTLVSSDIPDLSETYVTLSTPQTIIGAKTFTTNAVTIGSTSSLSVHENSHIDIGPLRIEYDSANKALHITRADSSDTNLYSLYADGFLAAGGTGQTT